MTEQTEVDLVASLRLIGEMGPEGGSTDPLIDVFSALARQAANVIERRTPTGWRLVPIEPTDAMKRASRLTQQLHPGVEISRITMWGCNAWAAMLDAAPTPANPEAAP